MVEGAIHKKSYYKWLCEKSGLEGPLAHFLFETDFEWELEDDADRAQDGLSLRQAYSEEVGEDLDKTMQDKLQKSVHGRCSLFELILSLANHIDAMVNDGEESLAPSFFSIMLENLGLLVFDEEDFDTDPDKCEEFWKGKVNSYSFRQSVFNRSKYNKPSEKATLWQQLNDWVDENTDEEGYFVME